MQRELVTWQLVLNSLQQNIRVMLLYVLESKGSSPGRQGFMMAVNAAGEISGSLGGGIMEHKFVELAKNKLVESEIESSVHLQVHNKAVPQNQSGMICSGEQTIFMYHVKEEDKTTVSRLVKSMESFENGTLQITMQGISFEESTPVRSIFFEAMENDFVLQATTGYKQQLCIIGAGHCSLALARLMSTMDFYIKLYDNRPLLNTLLQNSFVHEKIHLDDYSELEQHISAGLNMYIVIMTNGYRDDDKALRSLIGKSFAYVGVLGSKKKIEKMFDSYRAEALDEKWLSSIHAPAGLFIKSETPEEIAVSIAAEIISTKNLH